MIQSFPPMSVLRSVKKIKVDVEMQGENLALMDKVLKQVVVGDLGNGGVELVYGDQPSDAVLYCRVASTVSASDYRGRPAGYAFATRFDLMTALSGHPAEELFIIWSDTHLGCGDPGSLYNQLVSAARQLSLKLVSRLQER